MDWLQGLRGDPVEAESRARGQRLANGTATPQDLAIERSLRAAPVQPAQPAPQPAPPVAPGYLPPGRLQESQGDQFKRLQQDPANGYGYGNRKF